MNRKPPEKILIESLAFEIYTNYITYLNQNKLVYICKDILKNPNILAFADDNADIMYIEKDNIKYINTIFIAVLYELMTPYITKDIEYLESKDTIDNHTYYMCIFVYLCLANANFMKDFKKIYDAKN